MLWQIVCMFAVREPRTAIASPIQSWLEMASGDKRQKQTAEQIYNGILIEAGVGDHAE